MENLESFRGVRPIYGMPALLREAGSVFTAHNLLSHLALNKGRLDAFLWLARTLLDCEREAAIDSANPLMDSPWQFESHISLDDVTSGSLQFPSSPVTIGESIAQEETQPEAPLNYDDQDGSDGLVMSSETFKDALGHVWQSLGHIVLEAACKSQEERLGLMSYVYQVIAWMHTKDVLSPSIYQYDTNDVPAATRKSPLLHLTSSRIMATATESMWKANERNIIGDVAIVAAGHAIRDQELAEADFVPRVRPLGSEIWLELILWCCIHGGHSAEAAKLILHASKAKFRAGSKAWKAIGWKSLQTAVSKISSESENQNARSWFTRIASAIEGYSEEPPLIELPAYTISKEAVAVILDGILGVASSVDQENPSNLKIWPCIEACKDVLRTPGDDPDNELDFLFWNSILARFFDMSGGYADPKPSTMSHIVQIVQRVHEAKKALQASENSESLTSDFALHQCSPVNSIMVRALDEYIKKQDVDRALRLFRKLLDLINTNYGVTQEERPYGEAELDSPEERGMEELKRPFSVLIQSVPMTTLATFIDLMTAAKRYDVCKSILSSDYDDIVLVPASASISLVLQPALLRYATAAPDFDVLHAITRNLTTYRGEPSRKSLQALFHGQAAIGKWENGKDLLGYLSKRSRDSIGPKEIMVVAGTVLLEEATKSDTVEVARTSSGGRLVLDLILNGTYLPPPDPSRLPDYTPFRQLTQIWRMLASAPGGLATPLPSWIANKIQMHAPVSIDADAFNTFLDALVEVYGLYAGKMMFDKWCMKPRKIKNENDEDDQGTIYRESFDEERVVESDLRTIQIVLSPALVELSKYLRSWQMTVTEEDVKAGLSEQYEKETLLSWDMGEAEEKEERSILKLPVGAPHRKLFEWGERMYRLFDLDDVEIYEAMPEACVRPRWYGRAEPPPKVFSVGTRARAISAITKVRR